MNISLRLLFCKKCKSTNRRSCASQYSPSVSPYFLCVSCEFCNEAWFICPIHNRRWNTRHQYAASQHFNDTNIDHPSINQNETSNVDNNDNENNSFAMTNDIDVADNDQSSMMIDLYSHMSPNSRKYFSQMEQYSSQHPAQYLVHSAFSENSIFSSQYCNLFETEFHLQATRLCFTMTYSQHIQLVTLFHMLQSCINYVNNDAKFVTTRIPTTMSEVNTFYLTKSSSIRKSLPYPTAKEIHNHAYISLRDVLLHMFAYGTKMEGICPYDHHDYFGTYVEESNNTFNTPFMQETIENIFKNIHHLVL